MNKRQEWLRSYINNQLETIALMQSEKNWQTYINTVKELANELIWAVTEWDKCYSSVTSTPYCHTEVDPNKRIT